MRARASSAHRALCNDYCLAMRSQLMKLVTIRWTATTQSRHAAPHVTQAWHASHRRRSDGPASDNKQQAGRKLLDPLSLLPLRQLTTGLGITTNQISTFDVQLVPPTLVYIASLGARPGLPLSAKTPSSSFLLQALCVLDRGESDCLRTRGIDAQAKGAGLARTQRTHHTRLPCFNINTR